ncbi:MAG: antitoxin component HigA of HigAB toxin-antitoxin module [Flammeovirgaceae bacterium]|jgi:antitoxin component HigA of HigAB toxin-antitoxin module
MQFSHYQLNYVAHGVFDLLENELELSLNLADILTILSYQRDFYEELSFAEKSGSNLQLLQFIRINANLDGQTYSSEQIKEVLRAEERLLLEMNFEEEYD